MKSLKASLWVELLKIRRTKVLPITFYFFSFIGVMMGILMFLSMNPDLAGRSATISMKTSFLGGSDWNAFYELLIQIILTVGVIGFGFIASWNFGREFSDRAVKDLLALPVSRTSIVISKLVILFAWSILLAITALLAAMATGFLVHIPGWETDAFLPFLEKYLICAALNALLITPVAFIASAGRGYMLPIGFVILILIVTQLLFVGIPGLSFWFPWALPALYSRVAGEAIPPPGFISYLIYLFALLAGLFGTLAWWKYADHK
jgi:ABC-2 type transport system permease protein